MLQYKESLWEIRYSQISKVSQKPLCTYTTNDKTDSFLELRSRNGTVDGRLVHPYKITGAKGRQMC
jgi:hypothetical protein